eukprot:2724920-Pyramimonas_sp.AAC.1
MPKAAVPFAALVMAAPRLRKPQGAPWRLCPRAPLWRRSCPFSGRTGWRSCAHSDMSSEELGGFFGESFVSLEPASSSSRASCARFLSWAVCARTAPLVGSECWSSRAVRAAVPCLRGRLGRPYLRTQGLPWREL